MIIDWIVLLSIILFFIGILVVLLRKNMLTIFMGIELMINAANLTLVRYGVLHNVAETFVLVLFSMAIAAAEAVIGLSIIIAIFRQYGNTSTEKTTLLRW